MAAGEGCLTARYFVTAVCFGGIQTQNHYDEELSYYEGVSTCAREFLDRGCGKKPNIKVPVPVPKPATSSPSVSFLRQEAMRLIAAGAATAAVYLWLARALISLKNKQPIPPFAPL